MALKIGALARRARTSAPTIRYYEEIGLLPQARRRDSGQRSYDEADVTRLVFIRRCREFAFPIEQVKSLAAMLQDGSCGAARPLAERHLEAVRAKLVELKSLERALEGLIASCDGSGASCAALRQLTRPPTSPKLRRGGGPNARTSPTG